MRAEGFWTIDFRALELTRVAVAMIVLVDLAQRAVDLTAHYSDAGIVPRALVSGNGPLVQNLRISGRHLWTVLAWSGTPAWAAAVFAAAAVAALALLAGKAPRLAAMATWILVASIQARNPFINSGGDTLLRLLLFWLGLVPHHKGHAVTGPAAAGLMAQAVMMYLVTAGLKVGTAWVTRGTALGDALSIEQFARPAGLWLSQQGTALPWLTRATWLVELGGPLLLLSPWRGQACRTAGVLLLLGLQAGIATTMSIGLFQAAAMAAVLPWIPGAVFDRLPRGSARPGTRSGGEAGLGSWTGALAALALGLSLAWNVDALCGWRSHLPAPVRAAGELLRLEQYWAMFSPPPSRISGALIVAAPTWTASADALGLTGASGAGAYRNDHWRKLYVNLLDPRFTDLRLEVRRYGRSVGADDLAFAPTAVARGQGAIPHSLF